MPFLAPAVPFITAAASAASIGLGVAGAAESAKGAQTAAQAQSQADLYEAAVAQNNAITEKQNAAWAIQSGDTAAVNSSLQTRSTIGTEKAAQGANNVDVNSGSAVDVRAGTRALGMLNALTIRSNAARQAYGYQVQATGDTAQAQLDTMASKNALQAGTISADASLISGGASALSNVSKFASSGVGSGIGSSIGGLVSGGITGTGTQAPVLDESPTVNGSGYY